MVRAKVMMHDGMEKYDEFVDNVSAYEVLTAEREEVETAKQDEADRKAREKGGGSGGKAASERGRSRTKSANRSWRTRSAARRSAGRPRSSPN